MDENSEPQIWNDPNSAPVLTVLGKLPGGKLVKPEWVKPGITYQLSERTLAAVEAIGIKVIDRPETYLF